MNRGFWEKFKKPDYAEASAYVKTTADLSSGGPIFVLAPMANVTDAAFSRQEKT